mmetsp:Transcript_9237/g.13823  ORF Transcript_9237/g.13823 Transcript_9237/m.13823 type:complete len:259 (+) Transcript_9237:97-873(+)|eukprot:CAMPEP_0194113562 /NCGR_PEP_ID=MMETSP0150-20130528/17145_1 /TAXON_ID=122233 /ORGANISM="Chaetoceros debilis, Strain MM31A-1" /LENGTH=258 /DNA_ID=CAMNT_0038803527 /DNA_START=67 /DNA_END=843 /DNA_ORIENTATION=+
MNTLSMPSFRHSVHDEPTDDWTMEELLQWCHLQSQKTVSQKSDQLIDVLQQLYDNAERDIWDMHKMAVDVDAEENKEEEVPPSNIVQSQMELQNDENVPSNSGTNQNVSNEVDVVKSKQTVSDSTSTTAKTAAKQPSRSKRKQNNLHVEILTGPHEGSTYLLKPRTNRPCEIGRSKGKKFRERGISVFKDSEVSTSHGKFETKPGVGHAGKIYFVDTGSTNGTSFMGEALEDNVPLELVDGMVLCFGESDLRFTILEP